MAEPVRWLVVMAKEPRAGAAKTRLAREIGPAAAAGFARRCLASVVARLIRDPRWRTVIAVTPDPAIGSRIWPKAALLRRQGQGDLGARMQRVFDKLPPGPVVIVGSDIPEIRAAHIAGAFGALGRNDAVLGPCADGGYWLIGQRRGPRRLRPFAGVRWSSADTLRDTLANLTGVSVALLDMLGDVDDKKSHRRLGSAGGRAVLPPWRRPQKP